MAEEPQADGTQPKRKRKGCSWGWVEYLVLLVLIGIVVIGSLTMLGGKVSGVFSNVNSGFADGPRGPLPPSLVIKNADLSLEVESVSAAELRIRNWVNQMGGYIIQSSTNGSDEATATAHISFRVPADKFEVTLEEVQKLAKKVTSRSISGEDVTAEFADLEAQLKNLEATRSRLQTLLDKAEKSSDALEASKALMNVQGEIERRMGRKKFLAQSAALSKIDVALSPVPITPIMPLNAWQPLQVARGALQGLVKFGQSLINLLIVLLVWLPVWLPLGLLVRWGWPKVKSFRERSNL